MSASSPPPLANAIVDELDRDTPDAIVGIDLGMTTTKVTIRYLAPGRPKRQQIPVTSLHNTEWTPTAVSYGVGQRGQDDQVLKTGHEALRGKLTEGVNVYECFKLDALRNPRARIASSNGKCETEGGKLVLDFLIALRKPLIDFFDRQRDEEEVPAWQHAKIHITLSIPGIVGDAGRETLYALAKQAFHRPNVAVWPVALSEPEVAAYSVAETIKEQVPNLPKRSTLLVADLEGGTCDLALVQVHKNKPVLGKAFIKPVSSMFRGGSHIDKKLQGLVTETFQRAAPSLKGAITPAGAAHAVFSDPKFWDYKAEFSKGGEIVLYNIRHLAEQTNVPEIGGIGIQGEFLVVKWEALKPLFDAQIYGSPGQPAIVEHLLDMRDDVYVGSHLANEAKLGAGIDCFVFVGGFGSSEHVQREIKTALAAGASPASRATLEVTRRTKFVPVHKPQMAVAHGLVEAHHLFLKKWKLQDVMPAATLRRLMGSRRRRAV
ncbi:hypothetical protein RB598_006196 [Gaeumannomyces tritici]